MKELPILFSAPMVRAILDGSKTQTRRIIKVQPPADTTDVLTYHHPDPRDHYYAWSDVLQELLPDWCQPCTYGQPGDRLWVKETHGFGGDAYAPDLYFRATQPDAPIQGTWHPSIFMRKVDSRITLEITGVRVERLQDISEADAIAEGIGLNHCATGIPMTTPPGETMPRMMYRDLWEQINGAGSWDANPWVWVVEFKKVK